MKVESASVVFSEHALRQDNSLDLGLENQEQARQYEKAHLRLLAVRFAANISFSLILLAGLSKLISDFLGRFFSYYFVVGVYFFCFSVVYTLWILPLSIWGGYFIEKRFGLSVETFSSWVKDHLKAFLLDLLIGVVLIEILYFLIARSPNFWWVYVSVVLVLFSVVLSNLAPVLILPLFFKTSPLQHTSLKGRLLNLTKKVGIKAQNVLEVKLSEKTKTAEAALAGIGKTRRILISDTLLDNYSEEEIEVVYAHELGHYAKRDIAKLIVSQSLLIFLGLWFVHLVLLRSVSWFGFKGLADVAAFPLLITIFSLFALATLPLTNSYSRWLEKEADCYAMSVTKNPRSFIKAMTKLAKQNLINVKPSPIVEFFLYSHPSLAKRIKLAQDIENQDFDAP